MENYLDHITRKWIRLRKFLLQKSKSLKQTTIPDFVFRVGGRPKESVGQI
jgi:hypothetical protein